MSLCRLYVNCVAIISSVVPENDWDPIWHREIRPHQKPVSVFDVILRMVNMVKAHCADLATVQDHDTGTTYHIPSTFTHMRIRICQDVVCKDRLTIVWAAPRGTRLSIDQFDVATKISKAHKAEVMKRFIKGYESEKFMISVDFANNREWSEACTVDGDFKLDSRVLTGKSVVTRSSILKRNRRYA